MAGTLLYSEANEVRKEGRAEGFAEGEMVGQENERLSSIRNVMMNVKCSAKRAMEILAIPEDQHEGYVLKLREQGPEIYDANN